MLVLLCLCIYYNPPRPSIHELSLCESLLVICDPWFCVNLALGLHVSASYFMKVKIKLILTCNNKEYRKFRSDAHYIPCLS